jgi:hypothetical protein
MTMTLENKRAARNQLVDPGTDETQATEVITSAEVAFISATVDLEDLEEEGNHILLCTEEKQQFDITDTIPNDGPISEKIADRLSYSNYIISPTRKAYNKMYDATTVTLMALHFLLKTKKPPTDNKQTTNRLNIANKLHPSAARNKANQFVLGRDDKDGALHQKFKHSQLLQLEQKAEQARSLYHQDQQALQQWKVLADQRENRLNKLATEELDFAQDTWSKEVDRSITNLIAFLALFKHKQINHKQKQVIRPSKSAIQLIITNK